MGGHKQFPRRVRASSTGLCGIDVFRGGDGGTGEGKSFLSCEGQELGLQKPVTSCSPVSEVTQTGLFCQPWFDGRIVTALCCHQVVLFYLYLFLL